MIEHYPLVFRATSKAAYLLGFGGSASPIGLAQNQVRRTLEFGPISRYFEGGFYSMFGEIAVIESIACRSPPRCVALPWRTRTLS